MQNTRRKTFRTVFVGIMTALSTVVYFILPEIPLVPGIDYLKIDLSDIPAILTSVVAGPVAAVLVEVIKNLLHLFRTTSFGIGEIMNVGMGCAVIFSLYLFGRLFARLFKKDAMSAGVYFASSGVTVAVCVLAGWLLNAVFTPIYFVIAGIPLNPKIILAGVWGSTLLNAVKAAVNLFPLYAVYLPVFKVCKKYNA